MLSILIIVGLLLVLVPNIIAQWDTITDSVQRMAAGALPVGSQQSGSFGSALWSACVYGIFQITAIGLMYQHTSKLEEEKDVGRSMIYMFLVDAFVMELAVVGLLAIAFRPELAEYDVPMLLLVQTGVGAKILTPIISILIILGAVSTGVNMIAGIVTRTVNQLEKKQDTVSSSKHRLYSTLSALAFTLLAFAVAQFGLIPLVKRGYSYIGYATMFVIAIPFILHFIADHCKKGASAK